MMLFSLGSMSHLHRCGLRILIATLFIALSFFLLPYEFKSTLFRRTSLTSCNLHKVETTAMCQNLGDPVKIPNIVHFVYILEDPSTDFPLQFSHFLSMYAAWYRWQPDTIYFHTNVEANSTSVARAREGKAGKWAQLAFGLPGFTVNTVSVPTHAGNGVKIEKSEHRSDFVRVHAVHDFGGIYIDMDVHALKDIKVLRETGYKAVGGRQLGGALNSGTFMSEKGGKLVKRWMYRMHDVYDGGWTTHSNDALTTIAENLAEEDCEVLILGRDAFAPGGWKNGDINRLFGTHEVKPLEDETEEDSASALRSQSMRFRQQESQPSWQLDFSCTFLLHAFNNRKPRHGYKDNGISPEFVLERQSNYALAVYPIAQQLQSEGIIDEDDVRV